LKALSQPNSIELVGELVSNPEIKVVLTTKSDFFTPGGEAEIIDGEFLILGKVIRVIRSDESINLLRKTTFGRFKEDTLNKLVSGFEGFENAGYRIPELITEIKAPAFQVIPIAIFI